MKHICTGFAGSSLLRHTRLGAFPTKLSRVQLATDWEALHPVGPETGAPMRWNRLYADGHVVGADQFNKAK